MEPSGTTLHNYWHSLAKAEMLPVNQMEQGIHIKMLKKGDVIRFETMRGSDGYAFRVILEVTRPKSTGVRIVQVVRFLGRLNLEVVKESFSPGIQGVFAVSGDKHDGKAPKQGWISVGADVHLTGGTIFRSVRNISVNDSLLIFPPSTDRIQ